MSCNCGKPKCNGECGLSPAVLQINNRECILFSKVSVPASMGDETTFPPKPGKYKNTLDKNKATPVLKNLFILKNLTLKSTFNTK